jgi:selenium metabolism protein YedF
MHKKTILISGETIGRGEEQLGKMLMANFLRLLGESDTKPSSIIFMNFGVRLCCQGSEVLSHLKNIEEQGVELLSCTTCLEYLDLMDKLAAGKKTTMSRTIQAMMSDDIVTI